MVMNNTVNMRKRNTILETNSRHQTAINAPAHPVDFPVAGKHVMFQKTLEKVQVGNDQKKAQSERDSHSKHRGGKN